MNRPPDQPVNLDVAREVCQRNNGTAVLAGSIAKLENEYLIGLNAIHCASGETVASEHARATGKDAVLKALDNAAAELRSKLGESLASVQKFSTPIEEATTSSLEALKAYSQARAAAYTKGDMTALPFYQRAIELDPNFAVAHASLSISYSNLGQTTRAEEEAQKAYDLRDRVSEREKYRIVYTYQTNVTGDQDKAIQALELWHQSYPRDFVPLGNLGAQYSGIGQFEKALGYFEQSLQIEPNSAVNLGGLAGTQMYIGRVREARQTLEQAFARNLDGLYLHQYLYYVAFVQGDEPAMQKQLEWAAGRNGEEDSLLAAQADTEACFGRLAKAREFSRHAVESARHADAAETAAQWQALAALREAEFGNLQQARSDAVAAHKLASGRGVDAIVAMALALAGDVAQAQAMADALDKEYPHDTLLQGYGLPSTRGAIALQAKDAAKVLDALQVATPYDLVGPSSLQGTMLPTYLRGQAYLQLHQGKEAAAEFQKILDHPGVVVNQPTGALARLGLARAYAMQGDAAKAKVAYQDFLTLWKDADPDVPVLIQAKAEYAKLQ